MNSLFPESENVNPSSPIDEVLQFASDMHRRGQYATAKAKGLENALRQLVGVLDPEEPRDPQSVLDNIGDIASRWGRKETANPETIQTYASRAKRLLQDYLRYMANPATFRVESKPGKVKSEKKRKRDQDERPEAAEAASATHDDAAAHGPHAQPRAKAAPHRFELPLPDGRVFAYTPPEMLLQEDLLRLVVHLMPLTADFKVEDFGALFRGRRPSEPPSTEIIPTH
jgi:hypothetical protein